jgi:hypothetical protein
MPRGEAGRPALPPLAHALGKAIAGEAVPPTTRPRSRLATADSAAQASQARGKPIRASAVWRLRDAEAILAVHGLDVASRPALGGQSRARAGFVSGVLARGTAGPAGSPSQGRCQAPYAGPYPGASQPAPSGRAGAA